MRVQMIPTPVTAERRNILLDSLEGSDLALLSSQSAYVDISGGQCLSSLSRVAPVVCFPISLVASVVQVMADGSRFEVGVVGSEGVIGWSAVPGGAASQHAGVVQLGGGSALVVPVSVLGELCRRSASLQARLLAFAQSFTVQMSHTIVANLRDGIDRRLSRWLLMLHDRVEGDVMAVTHGELASALHVRRASVTDTLHILEGDRIVRCTRGQLVIRDRAALMRIAGDSYGPAEASYRALIGDFGKG